MKNTCVGRARAKSTGGTTTRFWKRVLSNRRAEDKSSAEKTTSPILLRLPEHLRPSSSRLRVRRIKSHTAPWWPRRTQQVPLHSLWKQIWNLDMPFNDVISVYFYRVLSFLLPAFSRFFWGGGHSQFYCNKWLKNPPKENEKLWFKTLKYSTNFV